MMLLAMKSKFCMSQCGVCVVTNCGERARGHGFAISLDIATVGS